MNNQIIIEYILGSNCAGKTTLLKCMAGLMKPSFSDVTIDGLDARTAHKTSFLPHAGVVFPTLGVGGHRDFLLNMHDTFLEPEIHERIVGTVD